jgi:hypothetical protein
MFAALLTLVGGQIIGTTSGAPVVAPEDSYKSIMLHNASDGIKFVKPSRGNEDGCIKGLCAESHAGQYTQAAKAAADQAPPCHWGWC